MNERVKPQPGQSSPVSIFNWHSGGKGRLSKGTSTCPGSSPKDRTIESTTTPSARPSNTRCGQASLRRRKAALGDAAVGATVDDMLFQLKDHLDLDRDVTW